MCTVFSPARPRSLEQLRQTWVLRVRPSFFPISLLRVDAVDLNRVTGYSPGDRNHHFSLVGLAVGLEGVGGQLIPRRVQLDDLSIKSPDRKGGSIFLRNTGVDILGTLAARSIWTVIFALFRAGCIDQFPGPTFRKAQRGSD